MHKIEEIKNMKGRLMAIANMALDNAENIDTNELGEVVDMIKDLAEAEEKCMKAKYYQSVICAMEMAGEDGVMDPEEMDMMQEGMMMDHRRGYNPHHSTRTGRFMSNSSYNRSHGSHMRGYPMDRVDHHMNPDERTFDPDSHPAMDRFGSPYNNYKAMRRHYTESHSKEDKMAMEKHAKEHVDDTIETMRDIWNDSDPELRKKMKADLTAMLASMN